MGVTFRGRVTLPGPLPPHGDFKSIPHIPRTENVVKYIVPYYYLRLMFPLSMTWKSSAKNERGNMALGGRSFNQFFRFFVLMARPKLNLQVCTKKRNSSKVNSVHVMKEKPGKSRGKKRVLRSPKTAAVLDDPARSIPMYIEEK